MTHTLRLGIDSTGARSGAREFERAGQTVQRTASNTDKSVRKLEGGFARLSAAAFSVRGAFGALAAYGVGRELQRIFQAGDSAEAALRGLSASARLTGNSFGLLKKFSDEAVASLGLSETTANRLTGQMVRLTSATGTVSQTGKVMTAFLNLAAANSLSAAEAGEMLNNILSGQDDALNRLGLSDPSALYEKWGAGVDRTSRLMAVQNELMEAAGKLTGEYAGFANTAAGKQAAMNDQLNAARAELAAVLAPARLTIIQGLTREFKLWGDSIRDAANFMRRLRDETVEVQRLSGHGSSGGGGSGFGGRDGPALPITGITVMGKSREEWARIDERAAADAAMRTDARWDAGWGRAERGSWTRIGSLGHVMADAGRPRGAPVAPGMIQGVTTPTAPGLGPVSRMALARDSLNATGGNMLAALTGGFSSLLASMGPVSMMFEVLNGVFAGIGPVLNQLMIPLRNLGHLIGSSLAIPLKLLQPVLNGIAKAGSYVIEAFGWVIRSIGKLVDALPFVSGGPIIRAGQSMIDFAQQAREAIDAQKDLTDTTKKLSQTLATDIPKAYNLMLYRQMFGTGGGGAAVGGGSTGGGGYPGGGELPPRGAKPKNPANGGTVFSVGTIQIVNEAGDSPERLVQKIERGIQDRASRGSPTYLPGVRVAA